MSDSELTDEYGSSDDEESESRYEQTSKGDDEVAEADNETSDEENLSSLRSKPKADSVRFIYSGNSFASDPVIKSERRKKLKDK